MMIARLKVISGNTELGIENASTTPRMVNPTTPSTASRELDRVMNPRSLLRLRDAYLESVGKRVAARGYNQIAGCQTASHLSEFLPANSERDRCAMRAAVLARNENMKRSIAILEQRR